MSEWKQVASVDVRMTRNDRTWFPMPVAMTFDEAREQCAALRGNNPFFLYSMIVRFK